MPSIRPRLCALAAIATLAGCDWFDDPSPDQAQLVLDGERGAVVEIIASTAFLSAVDEVGVTSVIVIASDTLMRPLPFDTTFSIRREQRFFVQASSAAADIAAVRMQVLVDGDLEFDEDGPLIADHPYRFVYQFNQRTTRDIEVVLLKVPAR